MGTTAGASPLPGAAFARWRVPTALGLAVASLPLAFLYGYGTVLAAASLVLLWPVWRSGERSPLVWGALLAGLLGLVIGGFMLVAAVGLCGAGILVGNCNA